MAVILEGLPAVVLGVVTLWMTDRRALKWLRPKNATISKACSPPYARSRRAREPRGDARLRNVWLLALGIFATNTGSYALGFSCDGQESFRRLRSRHRCLQRTLLRLRHGRRVSGQPPTAAASQEMAVAARSPRCARGSDSKIVAS